MLIVVLVLSLPLSWLAARTQQMRREVLAAKRIKLAGAFVDYETEPVGSFSPLPERLRWLLCSRPHEVKFRKLDGWDGASATPQILEACDDDLQILAGLHKINISSLMVESGQVKDEGLKHLYRLRHLTRLILIDTQVTPEGIKKLQQALPNCKIDY